MRMLTCVGAFVAISGITIMAPQAAEAQTAADMMAELGEAKEVRKIVVAKRNELAETQQELFDKATDFVRRDALHKGESDAIDTSLALFDSTCPGRTFETQAELDAENARCDAILAPINQRVDAWNAELYRLEDEKATITEEGTRADEQEERLSALNEQLDQRIAELEPALLDRVGSALTMGCLAGCAADDDEQCFRVCYDGATRRNELPVVLPERLGDEIRSRTAEEAIQEYINSGNASALPERYRRGATVPPSP